MDEKKQKIKNMKSYVTIAKNSKKKADKLYARYKNYGNTDFPENKSKKALFLEAQQLYNKSGGLIEKAKKLSKELNYDIDLLLQ